MAIKMKIFITLFICNLSCSSAWASSADAWNDYQGGRDPMMEVLSIVVGIVVIGGILFGIHMINEKKERNRRKKRRKK